MFKKVILSFVILASLALGNHAGVPDSNGRATVEESSVLDKAAIVPTCTFMWKGILKNRYYHETGPSCKVACFLAQNKCVSENLLGCKKVGCE